MSKTKTNPTDSPAVATAEGTTTAVDGMDAMLERLAKLEGEMQRLSAKVEEPASQGEEPGATTDGGDTELRKALINHYEAQYSEGARVEILDALYALDGRQLHQNEFVPTDDEKPEGKEA